MVASQGLRVLANLAGHRVEHSLVEALKAEQPETGIPVPEKYLAAWSLLSGLVNYLERNYDEDQFDDSTKEFLAEANVLIVGEPTHVIYSPSEAAASEGGGFWSNEDGWGALETATVFAESELRLCIMPTSKGGDARPEWRDAMLAAAQVTMTTRDKTPMEEAIDAQQARWGIDMHGEHPHYVRSDWQYQVTNGNTHLGYWEWVVHTIEMNGGAENHCGECGKELDGDGWDGRCGDCADQDEVKASNTDELIDELGFDRSDIEFWVRQHYLKDFESADSDDQERWVHTYRQYHGMRPLDSLAEYVPCEIELLERAVQAQWDQAHANQSVPVIDQKTARAIWKHLDNEGQELDVRNKGGVDVTHFAIEDEDIAKFPCLKGVAYVDTWKHGIEVFPENGNSFEVEL